MKRSGSGAPMLKLYICMSAQNLAVVSGLATSAEKNTEAVTAFSSSSMPAFWQACFSTACTFCRRLLTEVWKTKRSLRPSFSRGPVPLAGRFQPAASNTALALSMLNSARWLGLR